MKRKRLTESVRRWNKRLDQLTSQKARTYFSHGKIVHCDKLHKWPVAYDQDSAWAAFIDTLPRKPIHFLAMVAQQERKRQIEALVTAKRAKGRERYTKRMRKEAR